MADPPLAKTHQHLMPPPRSHSQKWPSPFLTVKILFFAIALFLLPLSLIILTTNYTSNPFFFYPSSLQVKHSFFLNPSDALSFPVLDFLHRRNFNSTLLALAKRDLSAPEEQKQIDKILEESWRSSSKRLSSSSDRLDLNFDDYNSHRYKANYHPSKDARERPRDAYINNYRRERLERKIYNHLPLQLLSPRFEPHWLEFRRLLQEWVSNKKKLGHEEPHLIMKELLHLVKDPIDRAAMEAWKKKNASSIEYIHHNIRFGKPYPSCAVVGNSGILLNQSYGSLIDSHDMVIRLNNARIKGFEPHVGYKTTISFVNSNILHLCERRANCFCHPYGNEVPLVMYICQVVHFMDVAVCSSKLMNEAPIIVTDARFDTLCSRIVKYYSLKLFLEMFPGRDLSDWANAHEGALFHYSSGMQAVLLAVGICEKVSVFGFGKSPAARHHYHSLQKEELHLHDYYAEYEFYKDLATRNPRLVPFLDEAGLSIPPLEIYW